MAQSIACVLVGHRVEALKGGYLLTLELSEGLTVTVGSDFKVTGGTGVEHFYPALAMEPSGGLLHLIGARVISASATLAGGLELAFDCGRALSAPPFGAEEPWTITGPGGPLFSSLPGGYLTGRAQP